MNLQFVLASFLFFSLGSANNHLDPRIATADTEFRVMLKSTSEEAGVPPPEIILNHTPKPEHLGMFRSFRTKKGDVVGWKVEVDPTFLMTSTKEYKWLVAAALACDKKAGMFEEKLPEDMSEVAEKSSKCTCEQVGMKIYAQYVIEKTISEKPDARLPTLDRVIEQLEIRFGAHIPYRRYGR